MTICGIDCGFQGGITILIEEQDPIVYKMPVNKEIKKVKGKKKTKQSYDLLEIRKIFKDNLDKNSTIFIEKVSSMPGEGSVSSFNFGKGFGSMVGIIVGLFGHVPIEVSSQSWKKYFPELITDNMREIKAEMKELRLIGRKIEGKEEKKENKRQLDKLGRQFKKNAKEQARVLSSVKYPKLSDKFKKVNTDGMAESLLIALYGRDKQMAERLLTALYGEDS